MCTPCTCSACAQPTALLPAQVKELVQQQEAALLLRPLDACRRLFTAVYPLLPSSAVQHVALLLGLITACVEALAQVGPGAWCAVLWICSVASWAGAVYRTSPNYYATACMEALAQVGPGTAWRDHASAVRNPQ